VGNDEGFSMLPHHSNGTLQKQLTHLHVGNQSGAMQAATETERLPPRLTRPPTSLSSSYCARTRRRRATLQGLRRGCALEGTLV